MLPMPLTSDWSSSARLIPVRRARILAVTAARSKAGSSGSGAMCAMAGGQDRAAERERQVTERPLVGEAQVRTAVGEGEPDPDVRATAAGRVPDQQLAAHAQVGEQRVVADGQPQVLPAPPRAGDGRPRSAAAKSSGPAR